MEKQVSVKVDATLYQRMQERRIADGVPIAAQLRRAVDAWLTRSAAGQDAQPSGASA